MRLISFIIKSLNHRCARSRHKILLILLFPWVGYVNTFCNSLSLLQQEVFGKKNELLKSVRSWRDPCSNSWCEAIRWYPLPNNVLGNISESYLSIFLFLGFLFNRRASFRNSRSVSQHLHTNWSSRKWGAGEWIKSICL